MRTMRYKHTLRPWLALSLFLFALHELSAAREESPEAAIAALLESQVGAWNSGRLEEFMAAYWKSPELSFYSGGLALSGWEATLERYRRRYQSEGREMGSLLFSHLRIEVLCPEVAVARGRWQLTFSSGDRTGGLFTLVLRRLPEGWRIIHDHTSSGMEN